MELSSSSLNWLKSLLPFDQGLQNGWRSWDGWRWWWFEREVRFFFRLMMMGLAEAKSYLGIKFDLGKQSPWQSKLWWVTHMWVSLIMFTLHARLVHLISSHYFIVQRVKKILFYWFVCFPVRFQTEWCFKDLNEGHWLI